MWVYAFAVAVGTVEHLGEEINGRRSRYTVDPFAFCHEVHDTIALHPPDMVVAAENIPTVYPYLDDPPAMTAVLGAGAQVLAAVCLGSTSTVYHLPDGNYWRAERDDLTLSGRVLIASLETLYQRGLELITYVDT